jgi:hypothetical protein
LGHQLAYQKQKCIGGSFLNIFNQEACMDCD